MRIRIPTLIAAASALLLAACAHNNPNVPRSAQSRAMHFNEMDKDDDNRLYPRELETDLILFRDFAHFDTDNNGWIGRGEFEAYLEAVDEPVVEVYD